MIVFTATNTVTHRVYVGSTQDDLEMHWAQIIEQAEQNPQGGIHEAIQSHGAEAFEVEEWAHAESGRELRALVKEAQEVLGAVPIKAVKAPLRKPKVESSRLDVDLTSDMAQDEWDEPLSDWMESHRQDKLDATAKTEPQVVEEEKPALSALDQIKATLSEISAQERPAVQNKVKTPPKRPSSPSLTKPAKTADASPKISSGRTGSAAKEKRIKEAIEREKAERDQYRQKQSTEDAEAMKQLMMRIEARRLASKKTNKKPVAKASSSAKKAPEAKSSETANTSSRTAVTSSVATAKRSATSKSSSRSQKPSVASNKMATGRTGSSAKEKRIKEAIEAEKARLEAEKRKKAESESDEMAALIARLDARGKDAERYKRKR